MIKEAFSKATGDHVGFYSEDKFYLQVCPRCRRENYGPMVATGICSNCGWQVSDGDFEITTELPERLVNGQQ